MPLPYGNYFPQPGFSFNRTRVAGIRFAYDPGSTVADLGGGHYTAIDPANTVFVDVAVDPRIFAASSNGYTLSYVITTSQYRFLPLPNPPNPLPFYLSFVWDDTLQLPLLQYSPTNPAGTQLTTYSWPVPTSPWFKAPWL